jgi:hypothetical protein|nr:MAG TPA_asm: hypothetical protein [Caudoviricetes sp.]
MLKKILVLVMLAMTICSISFASEQDIVNSFTSFTNGIISEIQESHNRGDSQVKWVPFNEYSSSGYWSKFGIDGLNASIDIRKTNSLVTPYIGILNLSAEQFRYKYSKGANAKAEFSTKVAAENAKIKGAGVQLVSRFTYGYQNESWVLKKREWKYQFIDDYWHDGKLLTPQQEFILNYK